MVYWREPLLLWLMLLPLAIHFVSAFSEKKRLAQMVDAELLPWVRPPRRSGHERLNSLLVTAVWTLLILALAGPRTPQFIPQDLTSAQDRVIILLDYSDSMRAKDAVGARGVVPRITAATQLVNSWLDPDARKVETGLLVFSGRAHWLLKPTLDSHLIQHFLAQGDELRLPTLGSNLVDALNLIQSLPREADTKTHIVLLTDGEVAQDNRESLESALFALQASMPMSLNLIGLGSAEPIQVPGHPSVNTQMNSMLLKSLASLHPDFSYKTPESLFGQPLVKWLNIESKPIAPENAARVVWYEWFAIPLLIALLLTLVLIHPSTWRRSHV